MTRRGHKERGGSTLIEFTLVGIPMIFVLISTFEMARGMWTYHTVAYAVKEGTRYASVHGANCNIAPNNCTVTITNVANVIKTAGVGLLPTELTVVFTSAAGASSSQTLDYWITNGSSTWPPTTPTGTNSVGQSITITAKYPFRSALAMFWPGTSAQRGAGLVYLPASSTDKIQF
jgi:Flp pilus assembly protein TadG